jgi:hypothetical protein
MLYERGESYILCDPLRVRQVSLRSLWSIQGLPQPVQLDPEGVGEAG